MLLPSAAGAVHGLVLERVSGLDGLASYATGYLGRRMAETQAPDTAAPLAASSQT